MKIVFIILSIVVALGFISTLIIAMRFQRRQSIGQRLAYSTVAFERVTPDGQPKILIIGDSTAVGVGAPTPEESVAGFFGKDFPSASIRNVGKNGLRVNGLPERLALVNGEHVDLMIVLIGGNDVVRLTGFSELEAELNTFLTQAKKQATTVVVVSPGNVGDAPIFPRFIGRILTARAETLRTIFSRVTTQQGVIYVDPFLPHDQDFWLDDPDRYYAADFFHPRAGYQHWYDLTQKALTDAHIVL